MENLVFGIISIVLSVTVFVFAFFCYRKEKFKAAILLIILGGLVLRVFVASDGYLHTWDEKYHALVAKNLIKHPLKPTLYDDPVFSYDYKNWTANHIWLEKGPIPLWSMAASIFIFGNNEIAVRFPSILISLLSIYLTFLIAALLFNRKIALLAAFFHSINGLLIELAGGRVSSDHVEVFFIFFVELAIYFSIYHIIKKKGSYTSILIGLFTGLAILCKWHPALLVFPVWMAAALLSNNVSIKKICLNVILAITVCGVVVLPYLMYIHYKFPIESTWVINKFIFAYSSTIEGHSAPFYYYFHKIGVLFGELIYIPLIVSFYYIFTKKADWKISVLTIWWIIPILVFSLAETKRFTYLLIAAPAFFILLSYYCFYFYKLITDKSRYKWAVYILLLLLIGLPIRYSIERLKPFEKTDRNPSWSSDLKDLNNNLDPTENIIVFNIEHNIEAMYYSNFTVYDFIPTLPDIIRLQKRGYHIVINNNGKLENDCFQIDNIEIKKLTFK